MVMIFFGVIMICGVASVSLSPVQVLIRYISRMPIRSICACKVILEFCTGDIHEMIGLHVVGPRLVGVVYIHQPQIGIKDVLPVTLLRHCRVMFSMCLLKLAEGNIEWCH